MWACAALGIAAMLATAVLPLVHRHHEVESAAASCGAGHIHHGVVDSSSPSERPATPGHESESNCPLCVLSHSAQGRAVLLKPVQTVLASPQRIERARPANESAPPAAAWRESTPPRAPPQSIA